MNSAAELKDIIEWDIPNWSVALKYWREHTHQDVTSMNAMEIGGKCGGLSLWAALSGMDVLCTDVDGPTERAIAKHKEYNVADRVRYESLNALEIPYTDEFDAVLLKSVLGAVGRADCRDKQVCAVNQIHKSLKKGGEFWFAENLTASPLHQYARRRFVEWGDTWRYVTTQEMKENLSVFSDVKYTAVGFLGAFGRTPMQRSLLGRLDRMIADKVVPEAWRYIIIGIATK